MTYGPVKSHNGAVIQSGVPKTYRKQTAGRANGLLLRGVVAVTYVVNDSAHPESDFGANANIAAVYCDCICVTNIPGSRWLFLPRVLVSQHRGGIHDGHIWKPRASSVDITENAIDSNKATNPANLDGDHVLIGFLNDNLSEPVILKGLPHPVADTGQENEDIGHRQRLKVSDGNPDFWKHKGAFYGISDDGDFVADLTQAYSDNDFTSKGHQPTPPGDGSAGNYRVKLPAASKLIVEIDGGNSLELDLKDGNAKLKLGNGAVAVAVADHLETLYGTSITGVKGAHDTHVHATGTGPSGVPTVLFPSWDPDINSNKMEIPDT